MNHSFKYSLVFSYAILALACSQSKAPTGKAMLTGTFSGSFPSGQIFNVKVWVPNLVMGELKQSDEYETQLEPDGSFSLSIPLFGSVYTMLSINEEDYGVFFLSPDKETKIELSLNETNKIRVKLIEGKELTLDDYHKSSILLQKFVFKVNFDPENLVSGLKYDMSPEEYRDYILNWTDKQISTILDKADSLSENLKQGIANTMKWYTGSGLLFNYENQIRYMYEHQQSEGKTNDTIFTPIKPDKSYYTFLRYFDLNNPPFGNAVYYLGIYHHILNDSILNIPSINDQPLTDWLKEVKAIMSPLVGFDNGLFYDLLVLHAYRKQINDEFKPLSDQQINDIKAYFKNPTFSQFLFKENDAAIKQSLLSSIIKATPVVPKENIMDAIISQYKGKVVVVDFWATWCGPCMQAMKEIEPLKEELRGKNIVFVYITETSSPAELWKKKILGIEGEHYYLSKEEGEYIYNHFGIKAIPTYQIYDSKGILKHQIEGFPGMEELRKNIEELLQ